MDALPSGLKPIDVTEVTEDTDWPGATFIFRNGRLMGARIDYCCSYGEGTKRKRKRKREGKEEPDLQVGSGGIGGSLGLAQRVRIGGNSYLQMLDGLDSLPMMQPFMAAIRALGVVKYQPIRWGANQTRRITVNLPALPRDTVLKGPGGDKYDALKDVMCPCAGKVHNHVRPSFSITVTG